MSSASGSGGRKVLNKNQKFKRDKLRNARNIRTQAVSYDKNNHDLSKEGGSLLNVNNFVNTRAFEIKQLYSSMHQSRRSNATRVFQSLPRKLRRRTASHNIARIPKRMRNRAKREMNKNNNNNEKVNNISGGLTIAAKKRSKKSLNAKQFYRAKMSIKLLRLFTKTKNLKMLSGPKELTLRNITTRQKIKHFKDILKNKLPSSSTAIACNNQMGSYDNTAVDSLATKTYSRIKYLKRQKHFKWLSTHIWHAKRSHLIKRWGYQIPYSPTQKCYKLTHRIGSSVASSDGNLLQDTSFIGNMIIQNESSTDELSDLIASLTNKKGNKKVYRVHQCYFEGLLYNIDNENSISNAILGPADLLWINENKVLLRLHPSFYEVVFKAILKKVKLNKNFKVYDCRYSIGSINLCGAKTLSSLSSILRTVKNEGKESSSYQTFTKLSKLTDYSILPKQTLFAFRALDPRFVITPKAVTPNNGEINIADICKLNEINKDEVKAILEMLSDPETRKESYKNQATLKQLHKRKEAQSSGEASTNQNIIMFKRDYDPLIPVVIAKRPKTGDWVLLLPWNWVLPFWYQLHKVSKSYHIGLRQNQLLHFESQSLYFPDDYPFTKIGFKENYFYKRDAAMKKWESKPSSHRLNYDKIKEIHDLDLPAIQGEVGDYFSCDWLFLQILINSITYLSKDGNDLISINSSKTMSMNEHCGLRELRSVNDIMEFYNDIKVKPIEEDTPILSLHNIKNKSKNKLNPILFDKLSPQLSIIKTPLPVTPISCILNEKGHPTDNARIYQIPSEHLEHWKSVAKGVYRSNGRRNHELNHPKPNVKDLIGFVTSGTFSLSQGKGVGNGFVHSNYIYNSTHDYVLIRNVGTNVYRVSQWKLINI
ncbi:hypothetical protein TPHA_0O01880 [Tetrapisispora phaffii CBS 4417]|uniref:Pop1 N-terminal domain-containing protein n=1 Tax=Tetrapisispora phaffii (strain ATCC 24235 / CBS 4417 / NBRC 1672 / NRRL Y-8282 / UCD 70-5) TaxID=1071381 RepID=G8C1X7_TETPH|nr:hypothetical protein TPHA_0O01880 [Tetrapisispora phaffii CBS 4417]CCE66155.1 hypothetical protein TPHA_0O01880 [Tetrapisispora phaffii CBS 4417]